MKENFLRTTAEFRALAISQAANNAVLISVVIREVELRHIAGFFKTRRALGMHERMVLSPKDGAGGGPANIDLRRKTRQIQELRQQLMLTTTSKEGEPVAMEVHTILEDKGEEEEKDSMESATEDTKSLFFVEPDHEDVRNYDRVPEFTESKER